MALVFRPATAADAELAAPLIYSSGPAAFDYVFTLPGRIHARDFLARAFLDGAGEFGFRNHVVGVVADRVVAVGAAWSGRATFGFTLAAARQILSCYGPLAAPATVLRGIRVEAVIQPPARSCWYLAHLAVEERQRGRGVGAALVTYLLAQGRERGYARAELDVAATNPHAERLYARLGFALTTQRTSELANAQGRVPHQRRMQRPLEVDPA